MNATATDISAKQLPLREVGELLIKHLNIHEGKWEIAFELQVGIGQFGQIPNDVLPGAMFRISRIGLKPVQVVSAQTIDAAVVNPATAGDALPKFIPSKE